MYVFPKKERKKKKEKRKQNVCVDYCIEPILHNMYSVCLQFSAILEWKPFSHPNNEVRNFFLVINSLIANQNNELQQQ